jgi:3-oxoacyl-(acyl-carrier-protein) synthase
VACRVVITGVGLVTPLGHNVRDVLHRVRQHESAASAPPFDTSAFSCPLSAAVTGFDAEQHFPENKTLRLMNRDAKLAVVAARLAMQDAGIAAGETYPAEQIALYGATGLTSLSVEEVRPLIRLAAGQDGSLDLGRFGGVALKRIRPVLSFKILANMPICFVSILEGIRGPNAVYTPWEGQGAQAIAAGIRAVRRGEVPCALVGGCDVKTELLSFVSLHQLGALASWSRHGQGCIPGEGAAFLVLEDERLAARRGARTLARVGDYAVRSSGWGMSRKDAFAAVLSGLAGVDRPAVISAADGDPCLADDERHALHEAGVRPASVLHPKSHLGNLFAAAAAVQVAMGAALVATEPDARSALANCLGFGTQHAAFLLEAP